MQRETHKLDATDQSLGRLATQVAVLLRGKQKPEFQPNADSGDFVTIENIKKLKVTGKKMDQKKYYHYSGYPGGLKETTLKRLVADKGMGEALRRAVWNMLPKNKQRSEMIKRLTVK